MAGVEGRVALVTGAGSREGIGFATARLLRVKGAKVAISSTNDLSILIVSTGKRRR